MRTAPAAPVLLRRALAPPEEARSHVGQRAVHPCRLPGGGGPGHPGRAARFTGNGTFTDQSVGVTHRGQDVAQPVENYAEAFPDMHREPYDVHVQGDVVTVEPPLKGTHTGPLHTPFGVIAPTGKAIQASCCDVFQIRDGKIASFNCFAFF
ncbi:ester cyclase [Streptomyces sp. NPDC096013]|uniref:ester cyclase n=1 Tax=Streptomyces sp. NPDC096013 TaxID=3366069 RepID=UPI00380889B4